MTYTNFDFLWPVTEDGEHRGDIRFTGFVYPNWSFLSRHKHMDVDFESITWNTKDGIADLTDALNVFGWPKHLFPDHQTIYALIREKYYNPIYLQKEDEYSEEFEHVKINQ